MVKKRNGWIEFVWSKAPVSLLQVLCEAIKSSSGAYNDEIEKEAFDMSETLSVFGSYELKKYSSATSTESGKSYEKAL